MAYRNIQRVISRLSPLDVINSIWPRLPRSLKWSRN